MRIILVLSLGLALSACNETGPSKSSTTSTSYKRDIHGVTPGMTVAEAEAALNGKCERGLCTSPKFDTSRTAQHSMHVSVARYLPIQKIHTVYFSFVASSDVAAVMQSISSDYKVNLGNTCSHIHPNARLAGGLVLAISCGFSGSYPSGSYNYAIAIKDEALKKADEDTLLAAQRKNAPPTPKF